MAVVSLDDVKRIIKAIRTDILDKLSLTDTKATHTNREVLDKFTEETDTGKLLYDGLTIEDDGSKVSGYDTNKLQLVEDIVSEGGEVTAEGGLFVAGLTDVDKSTLVTDLTTPKPSVVSPENMTDNSIPSPYVVTTSSNSPKNFGYRAFDGNITTYWASYNQTDSTIQIDLGAETSVDGLVLASGYANGLNPSQITLTGSHDGSVFEDIYSNTELGSWTKEEDHSFSFGKTVTYRYYKLGAKVISGNTSVYLSRIAFTNSNGNYENSLATENVQKVVSYNDLYDVLSNDKIKGNTSVSISAEVDNAITEKSDGIFVQDYSTNIASLENRSVIGGSGQVYFATGITSTVSASSAVNVATLFKKVNTNMTINNNGFILLKKGIRYKITFCLYKQSTGSNDSIILSMKDINGKILIDNGYIPTSSYAGIPLEYTTDFMEEDTSVGFYISNTVDINTVFSYISISEIARTYLVDPVKTAQEHEVKFGAFTTTNVGTLSANTPLVIDTIVSGNMELNSAKTGIKLETNKKYKISLNGSPLLSSAIYGGVFVYDLTHNRVTTNMICNSTTINTNGSYFNTGSGTFLETTEDLEISICFNSSVSEVIDNNNGTFNILVEEIKNPVVVEYTNLKEISNPLMSSEISQEAPIGTVISYMGLEVPEHYLACDGTIYNIADYYELTEWIKKEHGIVNYWGGDGITTFAVPDMRGEFVRGYDPNALRDPEGTTRGVGKHQDATSVPNIIQGGAPSMNALVINQDSSDKPTWAKNQDSVSARVGYRTVTIGTYNSSLVEGLGEYTSRPTNVNAMFCIKYENTHYAVNQYGGFQMDTLWEGNASEASTNYTLNYNVNDYDLIIVEAEVYESSNFLTVITGMFTRDTINSKRCSITFYQYNNASATCHVIVGSTGDSFTIIKQQNIFIMQGISKIVGVKGSIPTIIEGGAL